MPASPAALSLPNAALAADRAPEVVSWTVFRVSSGDVCSESSSEDGGRALAAIEVQLRRHTVHRTAHRACAFIANVL